MALGLRHWDVVELLVWDLQRLNHFSIAEPMPTNRIPARAPLH